MARWGSQALDGAIVGSLVLSLVFAARPQAHSLARRARVAFALLAGARLLARGGRSTDATPLPAPATNSRLVAIVAHEIRAPLATIRGAASLLDEHDGLVDDARRRRELLRAALDATQQLARLVDDLLLVSRITGGQLRVEHEMIDLAAIVHAASNAQVTRKIAVAAQDDIPSVIGDPLRVRQVVNNLLSNALANVADGSIVIATITRAQTAVVVTVYNEGRGIPPEEQSQLFLPFASLGARRVDSTGLGLYIAKQLVEAMRGKIGFDSEPGRYAVFWFSLQSAPSG